MALSLNGGTALDWQVRKIGVIGPGIVGMPMAALLARAPIRIGTAEPARVVVVQRRSTTSAWKVDAINAGQSPIGGVEPDLDQIVRETVEAGVLSATHDIGALHDADVVLVCVQTDKRGFAPDYDPLFEAVTGLAEALRGRPRGNIPLVVFESTLAPSSMATVIRDLFRRHRLEDGRDVLLGNSPNRVMPGRLVERVACSDKLVGGLSPVTPALIERLYQPLVTGGRVLRTNSLTAEIVKTLENAYRDVRIAYAVEVARFCDDRNIDFYAVREAVNRRLAQSDAASDDPEAVPSGGLLVPTVGVGGHCLPKDGILLWWRALENGVPSGSSLILEARRINDESPAYARRQAEQRFGPLDGRRVAVLGIAYRPNSEDTRNSPGITLARDLIAAGCSVTMHDPYVRADDPSLVRLGLAERFTRDLGETLAAADVAFVCVAHGAYASGRDDILAAASRLAGLFDGCNLYQADDFATHGPAYAGIGRGRRAPDEAFVRFVHDGFRLVERGVANELAALINFLNGRYATDEFDRVKFEDVRLLAGTCVTGCRIIEPGPTQPLSVCDGGFIPWLVRRAVGGPPGAP